MKFSIGYKLPDEVDCTSDIIDDFRESMEEVYFAMPGDPSGRSPMEEEEDSFSTMMEELSLISSRGVNCVLLFNAACYGEHAASFALRDDIVKKVTFCLNALNLTGITTTSPFIAEIVKKKFPDLETRASVNMKIGSVNAMEYLGDRFDSYCLHRELNRDPKKIKSIKKWCDAKGKKISLLANSGCLRDCPFQSFHDNLVAHEKHLKKVQSVSQKYPAPCWEYVAKKENQWRILSNCWIRPEDIHHYESLCSIMKLATRAHDNPRKVISAYVKERYKGNTLDLMEPGHAVLEGLTNIKNDLFPGNWFEKTSSCSFNCESCNFCQSVFETISK
jgi:collagenase-like PrtC family protease